MEEKRRTRSRSRDASPLANVSSNQLYRLLGDSGETERVACVRKRSVSNASGLRRSRTFSATTSSTSTDGARFAGTSGSGCGGRRFVPVLRAQENANSNANATVSPSANVCTDRSSCQPPAASSCSGGGHRGRSSTRSTTTGNRVSIARTVGRTPPPLQRLGRSSSIINRKSRSLKRMMSLRAPTPSNDAEPAASSANALAEQFVPKIAIVGAEATGKSTIVTRWLKGSAPESTFYEPTIEDRFTHTTTINGRDQAVEVIDTSGADDFSEMRCKSIRTAQAVVLVYDITQPTSLSWLRQIFHDISREEASSGAAAAGSAEHIRSKPVLLLVGNKVDCNERRQVSSLDGAAMAKDLFQCEYLETSARSGINVDELFKRVVKQLGKKASAISKLGTASVSRSRSFLQRTVGVIRPKRRAKIPTQWDSSSGDISTLRPTQRGKVRMKVTGPPAGESNV